jgi:hypothetical protein
MTGPFAASNVANVGSEPGQSDTHSTMDGRAGCAPGTDARDGTKRSPERPLIPAERRLTPR